MVQIMKSFTKSWLPDTWSTNWTNSLLFRLVGWCSIITIDQTSYWNEDKNSKISLLSSRQKKQKENVRQCIRNKCQT